MLPLTPKGQHRGNMLLHFNYSRNSAICSPMLTAGGGNPQLGDEAQQDDVPGALSEGGQHEEKDETRLT